MQKEFSAILKRILPQNIKHEMCACHALYYNYIDILLRVIVFLDNSASVPYRKAPIPVMAAAISMRFLFVRWIRNV